VISSLVQNHKYKSTKRTLATLADLSEIEGEYALNKEIRSSLSINEDMLKELKF